jgi:hypothetical protein
MNFALLVALGGIAALLLILVVVLLVAVTSARRRLDRELDTAQADVAALRARLEELSSRPDTSSAAAGPSLPTEYLITDAGISTDASTGGHSAAGHGTTSGDRVVLSATLGEPLVKILAFGHGVRRALSAENRNRIAFEMRREVKRSRKQRRRDLRQARRMVNAEQRNGQEHAA